MSDKDEYTELPARELPLSTVDNTPPLMLDLPDGQQLVVGKLPDGIVIEIATWRGTGRPDSRTNRMMLGVSYDEEDLEEQSKRTILKRIRRNESTQSVTSLHNESDTPEVAKEAISSVSQVPEETSNVLSDVNPDQSSLVAAPVEAMVEETRPEIQQVDNTNYANVEALATPKFEHPKLENTDEVTGVAEDALLVHQIAAPENLDALVSEIEEVASIEVPVFATVVAPVEAPVVARNMQDLFGARSRAQLDEDSRPSIIDRGHEIVKKSSSPRKVSITLLKRTLKPLASIALTSLVIGILVGPAGVRFTLPEGGLRTSMSTAENALVIVRKSANYQIGDTVVAAVQGEGNPDYFASIAAQSDTEYVLTENNLYHTALREDVKGKVLLVMPGIGLLLHKVGL